MSINILPLGKPIVAPWSYNGHIFSILSAGSQNYIPWLNSNFLTLELAQGLNGDDTIITFKYISCPFISDQKINRKSITYWHKDIIEFFKECIDLNYYIYLFVDQFFISCYPNYNKNHVAHDPMISGYDDLKGVFFLSDFTLAEDSSLRYQTTEIPYNEVEQAYLNLPTEWDHSNGITLFQYCNNVNEPFNKELVKVELKDYLNSRFSYKPYLSLSLSHNVKSKYGLEIYDSIINSSISMEEMDFRFFHVIEIHKSLMFNKIKFLRENGYISDKHHENFKKIKLKSELIRNISLKNSIKPRDSISSKIRNLLSDIQEIEKESLRKVLLELER